MPRSMTAEERQSFLAEPRVGVISVASDDGRPPLAAPTWYAYQPGGMLTFFTGTLGQKPRKTALIQKSGAISFTVQHDQPPYRYVTIEGSLVQMDQPPSEEQVLAIVERYMPGDQARQFAKSVLANAGPDFVLITIRPDRWLTADFSESG